MATAPTPPAAAGTGSAAAQATTGASVMRGSMWSLTSRVLPQIYVLVTSVVAARFLGPDGMGRQSFIAFVALSTTMFFSGGMAQSLMRYVGETLGRDRPDAALGLVSFGWRVAGVGSLLGAGVLGGFALSGSEPQSAWAFAALGTALGILHTIPSAALIGSQHWREASIVGLVTGGLAVPAVIAVLAAGGGITGMFVVEAAVAAANLAVTALLARRVGRRLAPTTVRERSLRRATTRYALYSTLGIGLTFIVFRRSEFFFLSRFSEDSEIALFSIAFATTYALSLMPEALASTLFPAFATLFGAGQMERMRSGFARGLRLLSMLALPLTTGVLALGPEALVLVYGDEYEGTGPVLRIMVLVLPLLPIMSVSNAMLVGMGLARPMLVIGAGAAVVNVALALVLVPAYDAIGAAIANAGAQAIVALATLIYTRRLIGSFQFDFGVLARTLAASGAGALVALALVTLLGGVAGVALGTIVGTAVFALIGRAARLIREDDAAWLLEVTEGRAIARVVEPACRLLAPARSRP